jgi:peptide/nickel transport system permease protein
VTGGTVATRRGRVWAAAARVVCWPVALAFTVVGLLFRLVELGVLSLARRPGERRLGRFAAGGLAYLAGRSDRLPPLLGRVPLPTESPGPWHEVKRRLRKNRLAMASLAGIMLYVYVAVAAYAGWIARDPMKDSREPYTRPTLVLWPLSDVRLGEHPLGTDFFGRDVLKLTVHGTVTALVIGSLTGVLACAIGLVLGAVAGYFGRVADEAIVWGYTTLESIPYLLLMLSFGFLFKKNADFREWWVGVGLQEWWSVGLFTIVLAVGLTFWVSVCRLVRAEFIRQRARDYVLAAKALGVPTRRVMFRHIVPNVFHLVLISFSLLFMTAVKFEVILSFLGVGLDDSEEASWGRMIAQAKLELIRADPVWWQITSATVAMFGLLLFVNLFTDALRDALDPRLRT